jgi:hypothetical protein
MSLKNVSQKALVKWARTAVCAQRSVVTTPMKAIATRAQWFAGPDGSALRATSRAEFSSTKAVIRVQYAWASVV